MALLHYQNIGADRPDILLNKVFFSLKTFSDFLYRTREYMVSDAAVKRLAFKAGNVPENFADESARGTWVQLEEPGDRPNEPESTFKAFMDENVREVFEYSLGTEGAAGRQKHNARQKFLEARRIAVLDRDPETSQLLLERRPSGTQLLLRPNTLTLHRQMQALLALQNAPAPSHRPLLRLMEDVDRARWPDFGPAPIDSADWMVLTDVNRAGTDEQRRFVELALATPDFMFLEGPPGSGKTTAICELIMQLAKQGRRVMLCASTHVAVDNVLERLMDGRNAMRELVIPVRIGERRNVSEKARAWQLEHFVKTERERLLKQLDGRRELTPSQQALLAAIRQGSSSIERMVLDAANLVCGTTIGIHQHPDIKASGPASVNFDVVIIDEASKTTFQEFLVPALLAKRWIIVGDPRQLSPFVDDAATAANIRPCLKDELVRNACIDVYNAAQHAPGKRRIAAVGSESPLALGVYGAQGIAHRVHVVDTATDQPLWGAGIVVGAPADLESRIDDLPLDVATVRHAGPGLDAVRRRASAWLHLAGRGREEQPEWDVEIAWRLARLYEQRFAKEELAPGAGRPSAGQRLREQIRELLPDKATGVDPDRVWKAIDQVRRIALPSILESLAQGFERDANARKGTALSDGLPRAAMAQRHVLLKMQHRMHPAIAKFSHEHIYDGQALHTPANLAAERAWGYGRHDHRAVWLDVHAGFDSRFNANPVEATAVIDELRAFDTWTAQNPRKDGRPWEAAVLTFYRGQEREIRAHLRRWTGHRAGMGHFSRGAKQAPHLVIDLCTVDRFQGHEADLVIVSIASAYPTSFLQSPNRLNVALTRARYQRIVIGHRKAMERAQPGVLGLFASQEPWDKHINA